MPERPQKPLPARGNPGATSERFRFTYQTRTADNASYCKRTCGMVPGGDDSEITVRWHVKTPHRRPTMLRDRTANSVRATMRCCHGALRPVEGASICPAKGRLPLRCRRAATAPLSGTSVLVHAAVRLACEQSAGSGDCTRGCSRPLSGSYRPARMRYSCEVDVRLILDDAASRPVPRLRENATARRATVADLRLDRRTGQPDDGSAGRLPGSAE
jgi:hypothetical protein